MVYRQVFIHDRKRRKKINRMYCICSHFWTRRGNKYEQWPQTRIKIQMRYASLWATKKKTKNLFYYSGAKKFKQRFFFKPKLSNFRRLHLNKTASWERHNKLQFKRNRHPKKNLILNKKIKHGSGLWILILSHSSQPIPLTSIQTTTILNVGQVKTRRHKARKVLCETILCIWLMINHLKNL